MRTTSPLTPARTVFISFITSMMPMMVSGVTLLAHLDERRFARLGRAIEDAQQRCGNCDAIGRRSGRCLHHRHPDSRLLADLWPCRARSGSCTLTATLPAAQFDLHAVHFQRQFVEARLFEQLQDFGHVFRSQAHPFPPDKSPPNTFITWCSGLSFAAATGLASLADQTVSGRDCSISTCPSWSMAHSISCGRP